MTDQPMTCEQARDLAAGYVLGALDRGQEAAVRAHLATCGQPHPEFAALGGTVPSLLEHTLANLVLVEPPASLRDRIMAAAAADLAADSRGAAAGTPSAVAASPSAPAGPIGPALPPVAERTATEPIAFPSAAERTVRAERTRAGRLDWALRIAAVLAIVAAGGWTLSVQRQLTDTANSNALLQLELTQARAFNDAVAAVVRAAQQPGAAAVALAQQKDQHGSGIAAVLADGTVVLALRDLAPTSGTQTYTAWVIVGDQAPINVGDFAAGTAGTGAFTTRAVPTPPGAIVAVTLEAAPGHTAPQGPIVSAGQVPAPGGASG